MVLAPVHAKTPPTIHTRSAAPGDGTLESMDPGEVKTPLPMTMLTTMANASTAPRLRVNVPPPAPTIISSSSRRPPPCSAPSVSASHPPPPAGERPAKSGVRSAAAAAAALPSPQPS